MIIINQISPAMDSIPIRAFKNGLSSNKSLNDRLINNDRKNAPIELSRIMQKTSMIILAMISILEIWCVTSS